MKILATLIGIIAVVAGVFGFIAPGYLLLLGRDLSTPTGLYIVAAVRVLVGILLLGVARKSRLPKTLRVLGCVILAAGILTPLFGVNRTLVVLDWWAAQGAFVHRVPAVILAAAGIFIVYVTRSRSERAA